VLSISIFALRSVLADEEFIRLLQNRNETAIASGKIGFLPGKMSQLREYIEQHPSSAQRLLGLEYTQLMELIRQAEKLHSQKQKAVAEKKTRLIKAGGGRQQKLSITDQILLTLVYLHHLPTFQMLGV
jgi:hypothetical protein